jgi:hypothetical protein
LVSLNVLRSFSFMHINLLNIKSGFSDRLRAITYYIAINTLLKNQNTYTITEKKTEECNFKFINYCYIKNSKIYSTAENKFSPIFLTSYNSSINLKNAKNNNCYSNINADKLFAEWKKSYIKIVPKKNIQKLINKINLPQNYFSIHLRTTDKVIKLKKIIEQTSYNDNILDIQIKYYEKNFINILKNYTNIKNIFIASDDIIIRNRVITLLKKNNYNVYFNNCKYNSKNLRQTSGKHFVTDLFCIAKSNLVISTVGAGVVKSAYYISNQKLKIIILNNTFNIMFPFRLLTLTVFYLKRFKSIFLK